MLHVKIERPWSVVSSPLRTVNAAATTKASSALKATMLARSPSRTAAMKGGSASARSTTGADATQIPHRVPTRHASMVGTTVTSSGRRSASTAASHKPPSTDTASSDS